MTRVIAQETGFHPHSPGHEATMLGRHMLAIALASELPADGVTTENRTDTMNFALDSAILATFAENLPDPTNQEYLGHFAVTWGHLGSYVRTVSITQGSTLGYISYINTLPGRVLIGAFRSPEGRFFLGDDESPTPLALEIQTTVHLKGREPDDSLNDTSFLELGFTAITDGVPQRPVNLIIPENHLRGDMARTKSSQGVAKLLSTLCGVVVETENPGRRVKIERVRTPASFGQ